MENNSITREISSENTESYKENGYLVVKDLFSPEEIQELKNEIVRVFREKGESIIGYMKPPEGISDDDLLKNYTTLNFPHKASNVILEYVKNQKVAHVLTSLIGPNVKCMQSMFFMKTKWY